MRSGYRRGLVKYGPTLIRVLAGKRGRIDDTAVKGANRVNSNAQSSLVFFSCWRGVAIVDTPLPKRGSPDFGSDLDWRRKLHGGQPVSPAYTVGGFSVSRCLRVDHNVRYQGAQHAL